MYPLALLNITKRDIMANPKDSRFKSYIDEKELESINLSDEQRTKFLNGETMVCEAAKVLLYAPLSDRRRAISGVLSVTTFKLSFASACDHTTGDVPHYQKNRLLGASDICLSSIDTIYQIGDRSKKRLLPNQNVTGKVKELLIICKNMRFFEFSFKHCDKDTGRNMANALLHHVYPRRHSLLFAYDYKEPYPTHVHIHREARLFRHKEDWRRELECSKCPNWRLSSANDNFQTCYTMMRTLIVPQSVTDAFLASSVEYFRNRCCPMWVWGRGEGAALVRMADMLPTITDRTQENIFLEHVRKSHPDKMQPYIIDLTATGPSPKEVQRSFRKLRDLCIPDSIRTLRTQDVKFCALLDHTRWMNLVSACLSKALLAVDKLWNANCTVVLQEGSGQDINCIISSLTQIMLDSYYRTKFGFQSLIQKEWVAMGHPFAYRLGHILNKDVEPAPVFLLFLDCVWQLLQQYPTAFQISETYLTTLWDSAHLSVFDTFLFNCEHDRFFSETNSNGTNNVIMRSVWDWTEQFSEREIVLFSNPLFDDSYQERLSPSVGVCHLDLWLQCYCRWIPQLTIRHGGTPQVDLRNRMIVTDVLHLQQMLAAATCDANPSSSRLYDAIASNRVTSMLRTPTPKERKRHKVAASPRERSDFEPMLDYAELLKRVHSFFPFHCHHNDYGCTETSVRASANSSPSDLLRTVLERKGLRTAYSDDALLGSTGDLLDSQSILNLNND